MRRHLLLSALLPLVVLGCPSETPAVCDNGACDQNPDGSSPDGSSNGDGGPDGSVPIPDGCDPNADPKDAPKCVVSDFGIFVDASTGNDGNSGSKELPMKSITGALAKLNGRPRIYVCEGTYPESVKLTQPISIYGGFACGTWAHTGVKPKVFGSAAGAALSLSMTSTPIVIQDLEVIAADALQPGKSSIAVLIASASGVTLRRFIARAGKGSNGVDGATLPDFSPAAAPDGTNGGSGGAETVNPKCTTSKGGRGGNNGGPNGVTGQVPVTPVYPNFATGAGGSPGGTCAQGGGMNGSYGLAGASGAGATVLGTLDASGWKPADGSSGGNGGDGQGGGGGAQLLADAVGGSGGAGGCAGAGGAAGRGGGASIALAVFESPVTLEQSTLEAKDAGRGGNGGKGQKAQLGGTKGSTSSANACDGGFGGIGGSGGGGGGGAGGVSAGILYRGITPKLDGAEVASADAHPAISIGQSGAAGMKGPGGDSAQTTAPVSRAGNEGTDGLVGVAKAVMTVP